MNEIGRKHPAHQPIYEQFNTPIIVFLTVCTKERKSILANSETHVLLLEAWRAAGAWLVGRYVIMPDHLHLFRAPTEHDSLPITNWITFWKSYAARRWPRASESPVWQRHFWDRQLRHSESYDEKWNYGCRESSSGRCRSKDRKIGPKGEMNVLRIAIEDVDTFGAFFGQALLPATHVTS
jgi:putative transposase